MQWDKRRRKAAALVAAGEQNDEQIAADCGVHVVTLWRWRKQPEFAARVQELLDKAAAEADAKGITEKANRVRVLNDLHEKQLRVIAERANDPAMQRIPGGKTGLLVRQVKLVKVYEGSGEYTEAMADLDTPPEKLRSAKQDVEVAEYVVDTGLLGEIRQYSKQAAQEMGQWTERQEVSGDFLVREYVGVDPDAV